MGERPHLLGSSFLRRRFHKATKKKKREKLNSSSRGGNNIHPSERCKTRDLFQRRTRRIKKDRETGTYVFSPVKRQNYSSRGEKKAQGSPIHHTCTWQTLAREKQGTGTAREVNNSFLERKETTARRGLVSFSQQEAKRSHLEKGLFKISASTSSQVRETMRRALFRIRTRLQHIGTREWKGTTWRRRNLASFSSTQEDVWRKRWRIMRIYPHNYDWATKQQTFFFSQSLGGMACVLSTAEEFTRTRTGLWLFFCQRSEYVGWKSFEILYVYKGERVDTKVLKKEERFQAYSFLSFCERRTMRMTVGWILWRGKSHGRLAAQEQRIWIIISFAYTALSTFWQLAAWIEDIHNDVLFHCLIRNDIKIHQRVKREDRTHGT
jgi:hypothetical protein